MTDLTIRTDDVDALGANGTLVHLRDLGPGDRDALLALHDRASDRSIYLRFFSADHAAARNYAARLAEPATGTHRAIGAFAQRRLVGVGVFERLDEQSAEFALLVADDCQHTGLGTLLLEHLIAEARGVGVRRFVAEVLAENSVMIKVIRDLGFDAQITTEHGCLSVSFPLDPSDPVVDAIAARERSASVASLAPLLAPRSVAVIGAGRRAGSVGHELLRNLLDGGFTGSLHVVNPKRKHVLGVASVPTARDLPEPVDLAIIALPADHVPEVLRDCGERGVRAAVILSAGFGESGPAGAKLQDEVLAIARDHSIRLVGPNCIGVLNTDPQIRLDATFGRLSRRAGPLAVLAQSGAFAVAVLAAADQVGLGASQMVSVGNKADVGGNDLLPAWQEDPDTRVIALYLESVGDPRRFARIAHAVSQHKPIIAVKSGRTDAGRRAGRSHTAAAASPDVAVDALFGSSGVQRVRSMQQLVDAARVLATQPLPAGPRIAIIGNSGGPEILAADAASDAGLQVVEFDDATRQALAELGAPTQNPVDLGAAVRPDELAAVLRTVLAASCVDMIVTVFTDIAVTDAAAARTALATAAAAGEKPVIAVEVGADPAAVPLAGRTWSMPVFGFPEPAAAALGVAYRYARWRLGSGDAPSRPDDVDQAGARALVQTALTSGGGWLRADEVARLLSAYGIPLCPERVVVGADAAVAAAREFGYPVAVKLAAGGLHKSDIGGVRLDLSTDAQVRSAAADLARLEGHRRRGIPLLVQPMISGGVELIAGAVHEPRFGPLVMLGAGGVLTDVLGDRTFRLAPLSRTQAVEMIDELRSAKLLDGYRGRPPASRAAVEDVLVRVAALVADLPEIAELDLNPLAVRGDEAVALDARVRVAPSPYQPDPLVRQLRGPLATSSSGVGE